MAKNRGWWSLKLEGVEHEELSQSDLDYIGDYIRDGCTNGEIVVDEVEEEIGDVEPTIENTSDCPNKWDFVLTVFKQLDVDAEIIEAAEILRDTIIGLGYISPTMSWMNDYKDCDEAYDSVYHLYIDVISMAGYCAPCMAVSDCKKCLLKKKLGGEDYCVPEYMKIVKYCKNAQ